MKREPLIIGISILIGGIAIIMYQSHSTEVATVVHQIPQPTQERQYPTVKALDPLLIKKQIDARMQRQTIVSPTTSGQHADLTKKFNAPKIRKNLTWDHPEGEPPSDAELELLSRGLGHIPPDHFKGGLSASITEAQTMMKNNTMWKADPQNSLMYQHEFNRDTMTWNPNQQGQVESLHIEFDSTNSAPNMLGYEYLIGAGESWGLIWKSDQNTPKAGVIELADQRKVYYYCEVHGATAPFEPAMCDFRLNQLPEAVYEYYQQAQAKPLDPFPQIMSKETY